LRRLALCIAFFSSYAGSAVGLTIAGPTNHVHSVNLTGFPAHGILATSTLNPDPATHLNAPAANSLFLTTFAADVNQYPGWTAVTGTALGGVLTITDYKATAPEPRAGGARMIATYAPSQAEINNGGFVSNLRWVQMITSTLSGTHIDPHPNDDTLLFYYTEVEHASLGLTFQDLPQIGPTLPTADFDYSATFELYLVSSDAANKKVTVHDGMKWGYDVKVRTVPEPSTGLLVSVGLVFLRVRARTTRPTLA